MCSSTISRTLPKNPPDTTLSRYWNSLPVLQSLVSAAVLKHIKRDSFAICAHTARLTLFPQLLISAYLRRPGVDRSLRGFLSSIPAPLPESMRADSCAAQQTKMRLTSLGGAELHAGAHGGSREGRGGGHEGKSAELTELHGVELG
jgi:hypothetical protein